MYHFINVEFSMKVWLKLESRSMSKSHKQAIFEAAIIWAQDAGYRSGLTYQCAQSNYQ